MEALPRSRIGNTVQADLRQAGHHLNDVTAVTAEGTPAHRLAARSCAACARRASHASSSGAVWHAVSASAHASAVRKHFSSSHRLCAAS